MIALILNFTYVMYWMCFSLRKKKFLEKNACKCFLSGVCWTVNTFYAFYINFFGQSLNVKFILFLRLTPSLQKKAVVIGKMILNCQIKYGLFKQNVYRSSKRLSVLYQEFCKPNRNWNDVGLACVHVEWIKINLYCAALNSNEYAHVDSKILLR